jgi:hypothetical protein
MKKLSIDLTNCYGIKHLATTLDFSGCKAYAIYAPNGVMKSSLAETFRDVASGTESQDRIFPKRVTSRKIKADGKDLQPEDVLVLAPYDEVYGHTEKTSTLLVDAKLRKEFEQLHSVIEIATDKLLKALKKQSGSKRDIEVEISSLFTRRDDQFILALQRIQTELDAQKTAPYANVDYDLLFDDKAIALLNDPEFKAAVQDYVHKYNELLDASVYFSRETFNYYNAGTIAKTLAEHGFFKKKHTVTLHGEGGGTVEVKDQKQLTKIIEDEKEAIISDSALRDRFSKVQKLLQKNSQLRDFENYLMMHEGLIPKLTNPDAFKEEIWKSYLKENFDLYTDLLNKVQAASKRKSEIEAEASSQRTQWERVIDIFNDRFFVPFKLEAQNRVSVMLGQESMLRLGFVFTDGDERATVNKETLLEVLSTGEKKAFYILNVIFEIEARAQAKQDTLLVVDDIADSFDYRNKYAIIQYLSDIAEWDHFDEILLTHNFDFFRTVQSRFISYAHCLMAEKTKDGINLRKATGIKNIFVNDWKENFGIDPKKRLASIPFIRNIVEYTKGEADADYIRLTSLLHWKADSGGITQADLDDIYNRTFNDTVRYSKPTEIVANSIFAEAELCLKATDGPNLENKILLAIAIRLKVEQYMILKIADTNFVGLISEKQTQKLQERFKQRFPTDTSATSIIDRVLLMTPENIHLNSFMYEPLVDMSGEHLRKLYADVLALK